LTATKLGQRAFTRGKVDRDFLGGFPLPTQGSRRSGLGVEAQTLTAALSNFYNERDTLGAGFSVPQARAPRNHVPYYGTERGSPVTAI
jgi:hypothetical protein